MKNKIKPKSINKNLANLFHKMADIYTYQGSGQRFRASAFENASKTLENMNESVLNYAHHTEKLDQLSGIGKSIASKIQEYCYHGKIKEYERIRKKVPEDLMKLMDTDGIGPALVRQLHDNFNVKTRNSLKKCLKNEFVLPKGIGNKKMALVFSALQINKRKKKRYPFEMMLSLAKRVEKYIQSLGHVQHVVIAGSLRRRKETIGDIDLIVVSESIFHKNIINGILLYDQIHQVLMKGNTKLSLLIGKEEVPCDIRLVDSTALGSALLYFTGSKQHNIQLRTMAKKKGLKINEYGLFDSNSHKIGGRTETEIYRQLGMSFITPEKEWVERK